MAVKLQSHSEQLAAYLKAEILGGKWHGTMPGILSLEAQTGVNRNTIHAALRLLEKEGILMSGGAGRPRRIGLSPSPGTPSRRVSILLYEDSDRFSHFMIELRHAIEVAGHRAVFAEKTLKGLGMNVSRVADFVSKTNSDAWVVKSGSRDILEWFSRCSKPAFAFFGRRHNVPLASTGPDKAAAYACVVRRLVELGHRRIVMLVREDRRKPQPGAIEQIFLDELETHGIQTTAYHLPDWENHAEGFHQCLDLLFQHTPPSALLIDEVPLFLAAQHHLAQRGIVAPRHLSMVCLDSDPAFEWFRPKVSHIHWDAAPMVRRVVEWTNHIARGRQDLGKRQFKAGFVEGGTIGPLKA